MDYTSYWFTGKPVLKPLFDNIIIILNNSLLVIETRRSDYDTNASLQRAGNKACISDYKKVPDLLSYFPDCQANETPDRTFMRSEVNTSCLILVMSC